MTGNTIVDRHELNSAVMTHAQGRCEVALVALNFDFQMIEGKPESLIGDRAYDSDNVEDQMRVLNRRGFAGGFRS